MKPLLRSRQAPNLDDRLQALRRVVEIGRDRLDPSLVDEARGVLDRGTERMGFGQNLTLAALAGATGTGKSSLFNRLSGSDLSPVGVLRPTTSTAQAAVWGEASEVLDWLGVSRRHGLSDPDLDGLVLLDLPDHDSTQVEHRLEADRLVELVDVFIWVVDPQKYADATLHDDYLRPLAGHAAVTVVVLNQIDRLTEAERRQCAADLARLLKADGITGARVLSTSTVTGEGLEELRQTVVTQVREERAAVERLSADLDRLAARLAPVCGSAKVAGLSAGDRERLIDALSEAAGVETVAGALAGAHRRDAGLAVGWPFTRWLRRFRPDPLRRLHLGRGGEGGRTSLPPATALQKAQADGAVRRAASAAGTGLPDPWPDSIKRSVATSTESLMDELDASISGTDLRETDRPAWWTVANGLQTLLATVAILGFLWLALLFGLEWLQIPRPPTPEVESIPWPTLALLGGLLAGFVLSFVFRLLARLGAGRRRKRASRELRSGVGEIANRTVTGPIEQEIGRYREFCSALEALRLSR
ncbi:MAG: GTPase [Actinomycetota bacterium]